MAYVNKMAEEWLSEHSDATKKEIWMAGYWQSTDSLLLGYCEKSGKSNQQGSIQTTLVVHRDNGSNIIHR